MSDTGFTKGPWEFVPDDGYHGDYVEDACGVTVCDLYFIDRSGNKHSHGDLTKPNANLIACAPEMYEMLEFLTGMNSEDAKLYLENSDDILNLLAKARGEMETDND